MAQNVSHRIASLVSLVVAVSVIAVGSVVASGPLSSGAATVVAANPATDDVGRGDDDLVAPRTISSGDEDYAMVFDGTSQYGQVTTAGANNFLPTGDITVSAWAYPTSTAGYRRVVNRANAFSILNVDGTWQFEIGDYDPSESNWSRITGPPVVANSWTHVALTRSASTVTAYVNGQVVGTASQSVVMPTAFDFDVGSLNRDTHFFGGRIDDVRIYSDARTQSEIEADMHTYATCAYVNCASSGNTYNDDNLVAYYDFNEGPAGTTGTGTAYNRVSGASSTTNLRTVGSPTYTDVKQVTSNGNNTVVTFPRSYLTAAGGWRVPEGVSSVDVLVIGGGGGGGQDEGGGGGAGLFVEKSALSLQSVGADPVAVVQVGAGGLGSASVAGSNGQHSAFGAVMATGGGGGGGAHNSIASEREGRDGGSGGGGAGEGGNRGLGGDPINGSGVSPDNTSGEFGFAGGSGSGSQNLGGGGGGAGGTGQNPAASSGGQAGGAGRQSAITGTATYYAGGGGGGQGNSSAAAGGSGGAGGGGRGGDDTDWATSGVANTGSGGGGGGGGSYSVSSFPHYRGGDGGSGVVIVSYSTANASCDPFESTYIEGGTVYRVLKWSDSTQTGCTWTPPGGVTAADVLLVAGGGSGGYGGRAGGGGAGQMVEYSDFPLASGQAISVAVGDGGNGQQDEAGRPGGNSTFGTLVAQGGGGGGGNVTFPLRNGQDGGSGGGGAEGYTGVAAGSGGQAAGCPAGATCFGNSGGAGSVNVNAGGGGGAGAPGSPGSGNGGGGAGKTSSITGTEVVYAAGGAGFQSTAASASGIGGVGNASGTEAANGRDGTGSGSGSGSGAQGGSGVVIVRYVVTDATACVPLTYASGNYTVVEFQGAGTCSWTVPSGVTYVDALVVGGGGGGGAHVGGGGGGGGVRESNQHSVTPSTVVAVAVGAGGSGAVTADGTWGVSPAATSGGDSSFGSFTATGGGHGGSWDHQSPATGGSGGGAGTGSGAAGNTPSQTPAQGFGGGAGEGSGWTTYATGGGGGAGAVGEQFQSQNLSGSGGSGKTSAITGASVVYGGGGGGGVHGNYPGQTPVPGSGGAGGGGAGNGYQASSCSATVSSGNCIGSSGTDGLGGGGGGSGGPATYDQATAVGTQGGDGGDGVVIARYFTNWVSLSATGTAQPSGYTYSPDSASWDSAAPKVRLVSADGSTLSTQGVTVTASATSGWAILSSNTATTDENGIADFSSLVINSNAGTSGTLEFSVSGYGTATSQTVTIGKATPVLSWSDVSKTYGDSAYSISAPTASVGGTFAYASSDTSVISVSGSTATVEGAGSATLTATFTPTDTTNYVSGETVTQTVTVDKASQEALTVTPTSGTYGTAITLATTGGTTGGSVSYTVANGTASGCAESSGSLSSTSAGTCTVTATMAGNTNYNDVSSSATTVTIGPKALTITGVTANNKVYDGTASATLDFGSASLVGVVSGDSSSEVDLDSSSVTGTFASSAVGTDVAVTVSGVALSGTKASSYSLTQPTGLTADILSASRTLSFPTTSYSKTYGDAPFTVSASPSAGTGTVTYSVSGSACTVNSSTGLVTITGAGTCSISASVATDGVYDSASTTTPATITVDKAPLTVTAGDQSVTYQSAASTVTNAGSVTYSGFVNSETASVVTGSVTYTTTYTASTDAGTSGVVVTPVVSGLSATNYSFTAVSGTVTVTKATQSVSFGVLPAKTYGDAAFTVTATAVTSGVDNGNLVAFASDSPEVCSVAGDAATVAGATSAVVTLLAAGTCEITASQAGTTNHTAATDVTREFTVAKRAQADVVLTNADTFVWGDEITLAATGGSGTGAVSFGVAGGTSGCSVNASSGVVSFTQAGSCDVTAQRAGDANHLVSTTESQSITIGRAAQSVAFTSVVPATPLPGGTYSPTATATSGIDVTDDDFSVTAGDGVVCSISDGVLSFLTTGSCTIAVDQAGDARFSAAARQVQTITVGALNQSVTVVAPSDVDVGGVAFSLDASASSGLAVSVSSTDTDVCTVSGVVVTPLAVGTCELSVAQAGDDRFAAAATATTSFEVRAVVPSAAFITSVSAGDGAVTVGFTEPAFTGGVDLAAYRVIATPDSGAPVVDDSCAASPCTVNGLANGTDYTVTVTSRNSVGLGAVSNVSPAVTPATAATAVQAMSAVPFDGGLTLSWTPPSVFGGGTFSAYEIRVREAGGEWPAEPTAEVTSSVSTQRTLTGLVNGTAYEVQVVTVTTANGEALVGNTAELTSVPVTVPGVPGVAALNRVAPRDVDLSWLAPLSDGGATVTGYVVTVTDGDGESVVCTDVTVAAVTRSGSCALRGLDLATYFQVDIAAVNRVGTGEASTAEFSTPSFPVPDDEPELPADAGCPPCVLDAEGNPIPNDMDQSAPGAQPGRSEISVGDVSVVIDASWVDADGVSVVQLPEVVLASGSGALATSVVTVYLAGELVGEIRVDDDGTWDVDLDVGVAGTLVISIVDAAGDVLVVTHPVDVVDTTGASGPRDPAGGEQVLPGPGGAVVLGPDGELLDGDVSIDDDGGVTVTVDGITVTLVPTADTRTTVDANGRLIVFGDARMRVGGAELLAGSSIVVFLDGQRLGAVTVSNDGTVDTTLAFTAPEATTPRVVQIDVTGADTVARSIAVGYLHAVPSSTQPTAPSDDDACSPCATGPDGATIDVDVTMSEVGEVPGSITIGDGDASVTIGAGGDAGVSDGAATTWIDSDGTLVVQTPGALALSGAGALAGTTVTIYIDGVAAGTATVAADGTWVLAVDIPTGTDGPARLSIGYIDADGTERVITLDIDVVAAGESATGPRVPAGGAALAPGVGNAQVLSGDGELLDATYSIGVAGVAISVGDTTVGVAPDTTRGTVTTDGRIVVALPATVRVTGQGMLPGATATVWVMSDPQLLGTVRIAADGTIDSTFDLPNDIAAGDHTIQIDTPGNTGERLSVAIGFEITAGTLPVTGVHADLVLAWAVLIAALGAIVALTTTGRRRITFPA